MTQDIDVGKLSEQINDKADRDLWNTVPNVWNKTLNTSQITNCITEIPQDIKLELKDGVLTLKAGSKVYVPNGFNVKSYNNGSLINNNGVVSGFSENDYLVIKGGDTVSSAVLNSFEIQFKVTTSTDFTSNGRILNPIDGADSLTAPFIQVAAEAAELTWFDGTNYMSCHAKDQVSPNTVYWFKWIYADSTIKSYYSTDGINFILNATDTPFYTPYFDSNEFSVGIRSFDKADICVYNGSIDLLHSYIKINDSIWWQGSTKIDDLIFDKVVIENDMATSSGNNNKQLHFYSTTGNFWGRTAAEGCYSGNNEPASAVNFAFWYDTANNVMKRKINGTWQTSDKYALPSLIATTSATGYVSIDQVFNSLGYVGSTMFMLPGIKGLAPDGLNEDGTLRNRELVTNEVSIWTVFFDATYGQSVFVSDGKATTAGNILTSNKIGDYIISETMPDSPINYTMWYNPKTNIMQRYRDEWFQASCFYIGNWFGSKTAPYQITKVPDLTPLSFVSNYSKGYIAEQSFPSDRYVDLTLGASGSTYTAPANGWFLIKKRAGLTSLSYTALSNLSTSMASEYSVSGGTQYQAKLYIAAKKSEQITCTYTMTGTTDMFRFVYAEGEK